MPRAEAACGNHPLARTRPDLSFPQKHRSHWSHWSFVCFPRVFCIFGWSLHWSLTGHRWSLFFFCSAAKALCRTWIASVGLATCSRTFDAPISVFPETPVTLVICVFSSCFLHIWVVTALVTDWSQVVTVFFFLLLRPSDDVGSRAPLSPLKYVSTSSSSTGATLKTCEMELSPSMQLNSELIKLQQELRPGVPPSAEQLDVIKRLRAQDAFQLAGAGTQYAQLQAENAIATFNAPPTPVPGP